MKIINVPHPTLKKVSQPVTQIDKKLLNFIKDLETTLINKKDPPGVGLSAPQVDKLWRVFTIFLDHDNSGSIETMINPVIVSASEKLSLGGKKDKPFLEGCLSIPNVFGPVWRHQRITVEYQVLEPGSFSLETKRKKFESFPARVVQHEFDHLEGILFTDRAIEQGLPIYREEGDELVEISTS